MAAERSGPSRIRSAEFADLPVLAELHRSAFSPGEVWDSQSFALLLATPGASALLAEDPAGLLAAFLVGRFAGGEAELITIGSHPAARRQGFADALLKVWLANMAELGAVACYLEVAENNHGAKRLYTKHEFRTVGRRAGYYKNSEGIFDALVLRRDLLRQGEQ